MTTNERPERQILNIGEVVDLDGYGTWAIVESYDEVEDIYWVTDRTGKGYEYVHKSVEMLDWRAGGKVRLGG